MQLFYSCNKDDITKLNGGDIQMIELKDGAQQLRFILEDLESIRMVALLADAKQKCGSDIVRLVGLAMGPVITATQDMISKINKSLDPDNVQ